MQFSAGSHGALDGRQTRPAREKPSAGQAAPTPVQTSATSQGPSEERHTVPAEAAPAATHTGEPLARSTRPSPQELPVPHVAPGVQLFAQAPAPSHLPSVQGAPTAAKVPAGRSGAALLQTPLTSHGPHDGRQSMPASRPAQVSPSHTWGRPPVGPEHVEVVRRVRLAAR